MRSATARIREQQNPEKQAAAKQTFVFPARLANEYPAEAGWRVRQHGFESKNPENKRLRTNILRKQDEECDSTDSRAKTLRNKRGK